MENKEQLEQLMAHVKRLEKLTEDIHEREIYPVAFFSEAFDITNRIQALLHRMEVSELALFERQMKVHQAQIQSMGRLSDYMSSPSDTPSESLEIPPPALSPASPVPPVPSVPSVPPVTEKPATASPPPPVPRVTLPPVPRATPPPVPPPPPKRAAEKPEGWLNETIEKNRLADLKKAFTLNDRFRFCRDLFGRDESRMNRNLSDLNEKDSYEASIAYLRGQFGWNFEDETVAEFVAVLEKRFS
ncbi:MAG: hypothetical protein LBJ01_10340 [Tannerella sp.]|jgi:hypothetical protein|nr:hypothetical protein [Tannerella sp.]